MRAASARVSRECDCAIIHADPPAVMDPSQLFSQPLYTYVLLLFSRRHAPYAVYRAGMAASPWEVDLPSAHISRPGVDLRDRLPWCPWGGRMRGGAESRFGGPILGPRQVPKIT